MELIGLFERLAAGEPWDSVGLSPAELHAAGLEVRGYYEQAALGLVDHVPAARQAESWFFQQTQTGTVLRLAQQRLRQAEAPRSAWFGLAPAQHPTPRPRLGGVRRMDPAERLLDAATDLMYRHGYEAVGVQQLCDVADVRKGSFYHWFPSKAALAVAMLDANWQRTRQTLFEVAFAPDVGPLDRFDRYGALLLAHNLRVQDQQGAMLGCRFGNFAAELATRDPQVRAKLAEVFDEMRDHFAAAIDDAVQDGLVPPLDVAQAAVAVLAHMEGLVLVAKAADDPYLIARFGADVRALLGAPGHPVGTSPRRRSQPVTDRPAALITMADSYVGPALARRLARSGFDLVLHHGADRRTGLGGSTDDGTLAADLEALGARSLVVSGGADLMTAEGNHTVVQRALDGFGRLDAVCLITGTIVVGPFLDTTPEKWELVKRANLDTVLYGLQAVLPPMIRAGTGQVVVFTSTTGARPEPGVSVYGATRAGANALVRAVGLEVAHTGVVINAIGTNFMDFPAFHKASGTDDPTKRAKLEAAHTRQAHGDDGRARGVHRRAPRRP